MCSIIPRAVAAETTEKLIAAIWRRNQRQVIARLDLLDEAAMAVADADLQKSLCQEAAITAHRLAGSLGMFGYHEGTILARTLEEHFQAGFQDGPALLELTARLRSMLFPGYPETPLDE